MMSKQWKQWILFATGLVVMVRGFIGDPWWYIVIGLVVAGLALWTALENKS